MSDIQNEVWEVTFLLFPTCTMRLVAFKGMYIDYNKTLYIKHFDFYTKHHQNTSVISVTVILINTAVP